jgi:putative DNA primase/helicase
VIPDHPYLQRKRLSMLGCYGLRVSSDGDLIIPMYRSRSTSIVSIQRISPEGVKLFQKGAPSKLGVFWIERPKATVTVLCEGFATGATCFEALPTAKVCVCFSASNMVAVAEHEDWHGLVVVAADNDHWTRENTGKNPGIEAAEKAAKAIGCGVAIPQCEGTDWNDLFIERLVKLEEAEEFAPRKTSPHKLRAAALAPIAATLMKHAVFVGEKIAKR